MTFINETLMVYGVYLILWLRDIIKGSTAKWSYPAASSLRDSSLKVLIIKLSSLRPRVCQSYQLEWPCVGRFSKEIIECFELREYSINHLNFSKISDHVADNFWSTYLIFIPFRDLEFSNYNTTLSVTDSWSECKGLFLFA